MNNKIIVITGYLASGKSTFALRLSKELNIPYLVKDTFKTALCAGAEITNRAESSRFSAITFDAMMYVTERLLETGCPLIIEGNFVPAGVKKIDEAGTIRRLTERYACQSLTFMFTGGAAVLYKRFIDREKTPERGQANTMFSEISLPDFEKMCRNLDGFDIGGKTVRLDTTDFNTAGFEGHIETARDFLAGV
ncbi:MAG: ATP-binding protein [Treponema sp.]|nr:ATP-binding protein [Treponema sp.]